MSERDAIGGYFSLELPAGKSSFHPGAHAFQSARAAFLALLLKGRPERVWMPWFICDSMIEPLRMAGFGIARYGLDDSLHILPGVEIGPRDWLLYVNYFGLSSAQVDDVLRRFPPGQVVIDCAQGFFASPRDCLATLYSPRKFMGVPDGGYLVTSLHPDPVTETDRGSVTRSQHLLLRLDQGAEAGYQSFGAAEESLENQPPRRMSWLTERLLGAIDHEAVIARRRRNFSILQDALQDRNLLRPDMDAASVPLCYPFRCEAPDLRRALIAERIFVATYWPDVTAEGSGAPATERTLTRTILPLPCDQRYDETDMKRILDVIQQAGMTND